MGSGAAATRAICAREGGSPEGSSPSARTEHDRAAGSRDPFREDEEMTRKDFELIADVMKRTRPASAKEREQWMKTVSAMAYSLASTNSRFDHDRFVRACGGAE